MTTKTIFGPNGQPLRSSTMDRRKFLIGSAAAGAGLAASTMLSTPALAQNKPDKIVVVGLFVGWRKTLEEEVAPLFEQQTGIKVEFTFLPIDALGARLKAQLSARDGSIDVAQFSSDMSNWTAPDMEDHNALFAEYGSDDDYNWDDFFPSSKSAFTVGGKLVSVPYRYITWILHHQPQVLEEAGISAAPQTFAELQAAAIAVTEKFGPERYGLGIYGRESNALVGGWTPLMLSSGGRYYDPKTWEIKINQPEAVSSLQFYGDLVAKHQVTPPEALTWEWDGLTSGGQADRYAMTIMIAPYATLMDDPAVSKTAGKWAWSKIPGATDPAQSLAQAGGWSLGVPTGSNNKQWAFEFVKLATSVEWLKRSAQQGNCPPRLSVLNDPEIVKQLKWAPVSAEQAAGAFSLPDPEDPIYSTLEQQLRPHVSRVILGQSGAQEALDAAANDWQRSLRRAGLI